MIVASFIVFHLAIVQTYLALYFHLGFQEAGSLYHAFAFVTYFTPVFGAILADSYIGKYW